MMEKLIHFNYDIIADYLSFTSLSKFILIKKIITLQNYILKISFKKLFNQKISLSGKHIMVHNRNSLGYFHWLTDTLPKIIYAKKTHNNFTIILPKELKKKNFFI